MKYFVPFVVLLLIISAESKAQKKIEFDYPEEAVADTAKKNFVKNFKKGHVLYNISCGRCHTKKENNVDIIPDFSLPQLLDYEMRIYPEHEGEMDDRKVSDVEMTNIVLFLRYKKKSGYTVRPKSVL
jgi:hypothetical protein